MYNIYLSSFSSSWQTNAPHIPATLHCFAEQFSEIKERFCFQPYFFHTKEGVNKLVSSMETPRIVAANVVSWNFNRSHKFLKLTKRQFPNAITIAGGNNVPKILPKTFFIEYPYIDIVVHGEGEKPFTDILLNFNESGHLIADGLESVESISFNRNNEVVRTRAGLPLRDASGIIQIPSPLLTGKFENYFEEMDRLGEFRGGVWETTRGCPYSCSFCDWGQLTNSKIRKFSDERVFEEIDYFVDHFDEIFFADANFGILERDLRISEAIVEKYQSSKNRRLRTLHIGGAKNSNDRMLQIGKVFSTTDLTRAGMSLSLQTYTQEALDAVKRKNISRDRMLELQSLYKKYSVPSYCDLIINCPNETYDTFKKTLDFVLKQNFTDLRMFTMDIYPNSDIASQTKEYDIKTQKCIIYQGHDSDEDEYIEKVISTSTMNKDETEKLRLICRAIEVFHLGRWTYFISSYCQNEYSISYSSFYEKLLEYSQSKPDSNLFLALNEGYVRKYNNGKTSHFEGDFSPFGISWETTFFRKELFTWLCIAYFQIEIYREIERFLEDLLPSGWNREVLHFNQSLIYSSDYDPESGKVLSLNYNWYDYFEENSCLELKPNKLIIKDKFVGRKHEKVAINKEDLNWLRWAAGGRSYFMQRQNSYIHQEIDCVYEGVIGNEMYTVF